MMMNNPAKAKQAEQWQRRKTYDPLRAVAQAKAAKRLQVDVFACLRIG